MAQEQFSNLPTEELKKRVKFLKIAVGFIGTAMVIMAVSGIIVSIRKGFSAVSLTAVGFFPLMLIFSIQLKQINAELKKRGE
ncbi:MAG TPA: hypothetical protein VFQ56_09110 [Flavobacterium sp.]|nr:hypothetical protein [Flavobacterium sp.]